MHRVLSLLLAAVGIAGSTGAAYSQRSGQPVGYVNPFICTQGDHGQWLPAANVPFGLIELCPDTWPGSLSADGDYAHSGYDYADRHVRGFSHFHKGSSGGTRRTDRAGLLSLLPFCTLPSDTFLSNPVVEIDKKSEKARPGYYAVRLSRDGIAVELTATAHTASHRYYYPRGRAARLFLFEGNRLRSRGLSCILRDPCTIEGTQRVYNGIHFVVKFNHPVRSVQVWNGTTLAGERRPPESPRSRVLPAAAGSQFLPESAELELLPATAGSEPLPQIAGSELLPESAGGGLVLDFGDLAGQAVEIRVGVSLTGIAAARRNLAAENPDFDFADRQKEALQEWNRRLEAIEVEGDAEYKTIFYTALYHTCFLPVTTTDIAGTYPGLDERIHTATGYIHFDDYAFWDAFRTVYPLYSLYLPEVYRDIVCSLRDLYEQGDWERPDGAHAPHGPGSGFSLTGKNGFLAYDNCRNEHMLMVMTDAWFKGLCDLDLAQLYPLLKREALMQAGPHYDAIGYIPARPDQTGEYAWDSWCLARLAQAAGLEGDQVYFARRAGWWRNTWDPALRFFRARAADGTWLDFPEDPTVNREKYTYEGTKWQWRWNVLHDLPGLIEAFGGREEFIKELSCFFDQDLYTAGNQIDLQAPYLFNAAGAAWLTQKWTHRILAEPMVQRYGTHNAFAQPVNDRIYKATPDGFLEEMDDDYGCMSAWYALGAMGLYQLCPGDPVYQLSTPLFPAVTIHLNRSIYPGKRFRIIARNLSKENIFIQSATLDGKPIQRSWISHDEITRGGTLIYTMGPAPNCSWGE